MICLSNNCLPLTNVKCVVGLVFILAVHFSRDFSFPGTYEKIIDMELCQGDNTPSPKQTNQEHTSTGRQLS